MYERTLGWGGRQLVLIGWPVDGAQSGNPRPDLAELRREAETFGFRHRYHVTSEDSDHDLHMVLGEIVGEVPVAALDDVATAVRARLSRAPTVVPLSLDDVSLAVYESTTLPGSTTQRLPLETLMAGRDSAC
ncbi:hypothetical protein [Blastococcus sp. TF02-8]|uniref:hypothetical protein n=1 Tax=Blastococcus sp. TF02-8 TaxID=2250574 RepID=UPI0011BD842F|nr:hypothetical protein [Blastococcus sp. TF02-8]